jgi:hypothetical protein
MVLPFLILVYTTFLLNTSIKAQESIQIRKTDSLQHSWEKFSVILGGFFTGLSTDMIFGSEQLGLGLALNMEKALGLETSTFVFRGEAGYNFGKRGRSTLNFGYVGFFRNSKKVLEAEINVGDAVFPIGTEVDSRFDIQIYKSTFDYAYYKDDRIKLGASLGLHIIPIRFSLHSLGRSEKATNFTAPFPVLGLDTRFAVTSKVQIKQGIEVLYLKIDDYKGKITDVNFRIEYTPWKHIGFGLGYNSYQLSLSKENDSGNIIHFIGYIKTGYSGMLFYGKFYF